MASTGLSRRRVGGTTASYNDEDDDMHPGTNGGSNVGSRDGSPPPVQHAGSAFERGNKVACDPRDLQQGASEEAKIGGKMPRLTIMEGVLLLGLKDKQVCAEILWRYLYKLLRLFYLRKPPVSHSFFFFRVIYHSGTTTFHTHYGGAFLLNLPFDGV